LSVYQRFVIDFKILIKDLYGINIGRLDAVANKIEKKDAGEWMEKARNQSDSDYAIEVKQLGRDLNSCKHEHIKTYPAKDVCSDCGEKL
jgi:hypothetical protein